MWHLYFVTKIFKKKLKIIFEIMSVFFRYNRFMTLYSVSTNSYFNNNILPPIANRYQVPILPSKYILNVLFTPCNLHWVISTSSSWMVIMLLNSRSAWQRTGYPWKSLDNPVKTLYDATNISRAARWIYEMKIKIIVGEFTWKLLCT